MAVLSGTASVRTLLASFFCDPESQKGRTHRKERDIIAARSTLFISPPLTLDFLQTHRLGKQKDCYLLEVPSKHIERTCSTNMRLQLSISYAPLLLLSVQTLHHHF
jgi:hypothetical protein